MRKTAKGLRRLERQHITDPVMRQHRLVIDGPALWPSRISQAIRESDERGWSVLPSIFGLSRPISSAAPGCHLAMAMRALFMAFPHFYVYLPPDVRSEYDERIPEAGGGRGYC